MKRDMGVGTFWFLAPSTGAEAFESTLMAMDGERIERFREGSSRHDFSKRLMLRGERLFSWHGDRGGEICGKDLSLLICMQFGATR